MGDARERPARRPPLPVPLADLVRGYRWARNTVGEAGAEVFRLHAPDRPALYLKHGQGVAAGDVSDEMVRLLWLGGQIAVPSLRHFSASPDDAWLLTTALPGRTAYQWLEDEPARREQTVAAIADWLRRLHALPVATCPFDSAHPFRLAHARARMATGLIDTEDFGEAHDGWSAEQVWDEMTALLPLAPDPVVTHGDFSLDNILMEDGRVTGCIDVGRAGVADRYQDLAILCDCLGEFDAALQLGFFAAYGIAAPDQHKIRFHLCLDEFF